jgi:hypothetical protein
MYYGIEERSSDQIIERASLTSVCDALHAWPELALYSSGLCKGDKKWFAIEQHI